MSYTSEEESEINFEQQHKLAVYEAALRKGNPIIPATKKRRGHPGNPGKETVTPYIISVFMSSSNTSELCFSGFQLPQTHQHDSIKDGSKPNNPNIFSTLR